MKKYNLGIVIGRFQPFHKGHSYLIRKVLKSCDKLIIGIGSSNINNKDNPFSYAKRLAMVQKFIQNESAFAKASADKGKISKVIPIPDVFDDDKWFAITVKNAGKFDVSFGNNDWVNRIFKNKGIQIVRVPYYKRFLLEGARIRELMKAGKEWRDRIPSFLVNFITNPY